MLTSDFDYHLPPELIAQTPLEPRDSSRLLVLDRVSGDAFLNTLLERDEIRQTQWYRSKESISERLPELRKNYSAKAIENSSLVKVTVAANLPQDAQAITNEVLTVFMHEKKEETADKLKDVLGALMEERKNLERQLKVRRGLMLRLTKELQD